MGRPTRELCTDLTAKCGQITRPDPGDPDLLWSVEKWSTCSQYREVRRVLLARYVRQQLDNC